MPSDKNILLHVCCAPCATHCIEILRREWDVTLFFANANIAPREEYVKRRDEARRLAQTVKLPFVEDSYEHDDWLAYIHGLENEPERGLRCVRCFHYNLSRTAAYARQNAFAAFTTTLTVSPHKRSVDIFQVGSEWERFLAADFKKGDGFKRSIELARQYRLYRQNDCGCEFSKQNVLSRSVRSPQDGRTVALTRRDSRG